MTSGRPRLVVVSAHFPPDFVSGGTLVPDRQARGLVARGWDVSVYAGSLDAARTPLSTWDEDVDGLPVHWIAVAPFIGWSDRRNFDHPAVVADFRAHLAEQRPDVVHLHALQTLGGGLVPAAREAGAKVVLTMHDFWWSCARQFLVDRSWVPCSLVVDAGVCSCEVDRQWLEERNRWLAAHLPAADLVLAPSSIAAEVLAANGVPADRLRVDENGLDEVPPAARSRGPVEGPVRFRYAGGANQMKGSAVLAAAVRTLAARRPEGWQLVLHADAADLAGEAPGPLPAAVRVEPPFDPSRLDEVLATTDVLVLPSIMRETHSLLTREALLRGVPVIASDSLGPEEVVVPGRNGLVVPSGDADALSSAMVAIVDDPTTLEAWSAVAVRTSVRGSDQQLLELDATLRAMLEPSVPSATAGGPDAGIERVLFVVGIDGAPLRYRAHLPAEALALRGVHADVRHYRDPEVEALARRADAVVVYRVPATIQVLDLLQTLKEQRPLVPLLFDVDDLIFDPDLADEIPALKVLPRDEADLWLQGVRRYRTTMEACDAFIGSTQRLCDHASAVVGLPAHRFANGVGLVLARHGDAAIRRPRRPGPLRVGYLSGTTTHDRDWAEVEAVVLDALDDVGGELWLGGHLTPSPAVERLGDRLVRLPMQDWRALPGVLRDLDVNLAPLEPGSRFNEAKSAIKWLEAALCATPTIASPTQPFRESVVDGVNGVLADTPEAWGRALRGLLGDDLRRVTMGARARRDALLGWSPQGQADRYLELLAHARAQVAAGRPVRSSSWEPVALDEPPVASALQPYGNGDGPAVRPPTAAPGSVLRARSAALSRAGRLRRAVRQDGWTTALRRSGRAAIGDARRVAGALRRRLGGAG